MAHVIGAGPIGMVDAKFASCLSPFGISLSSSCSDKTGIFMLH